MGQGMPPHPVLHHSWPANVKYTADPRYGSYPFLTNKQRWMESYDVELTKKQGVHRIFYLGDSNTQGLVAPEFKLTELVEHYLNEKIGKAHDVIFEVINTGTSSYSTLLYYLNLKKYLLAYSPDLVIINFDMTDVGDDLLYRKFLVVDEKGDPKAVVPPHPDHRHYVLTPTGPLFGPPLKGKTLLRSLSNYSNFVALLYRATTKYETLHFQRNFEKYSDRSGNWTAHNWGAKLESTVNYSMSILKKIIDLCIKNNIKIMVTGVPQQPQFLGEESTRPHEVLRKVTEGSGGKYLDSFTKLSLNHDTESLRKLYWSFDPQHFNVQGNKAWADIQIRFITDPQNKLLPVY